MGGFSYLFSMKFVITLFDVVIELVILSGIESKVVFFSGINDKCRKHKLDGSS